MRKIDKEIKNILQNDTVKMEADTMKKIDELLFNLPEKEISFGKKTTGSLAWKIAFAMAAALVILPNLNPVVAKAMYEIPYVGKIFQVLTVRDYKYQDSKHVAEIKTPKIVTDEENTDGAEAINADSEQLTKQIIEQFEAELSEDNYQATYVDYEVVTDTEDWFTLRLLVSEVSASGSEYYKYYHIDKTTGLSVKLGDLFTDTGYIKAISDNVYEQMEEQVKNSEDGMISYWLEEEDETGENHVIDGEQNFYFNKAGELVIVYDEYAVAPGYMGCPEFTIPADVYREYLKK